MQTARDLVSIVIFFALITFIGWNLAQLGLFAFANYGPS